MYTEYSEAIVHNYNKIICMPCHLSYKIHLIISARKLGRGSVLTSGVTFNFTQVKVKGRYEKLKKLSSLKNAIVKLALL